MRNTLRAALEDALDDEYRAEAVYEAAIAAFGPVRPFVQIVEAERRHVDALLQLFERYGFEPPPNRWRGRVDRPTDMRDACQAAARAEQDSAALYDRLIASVTEDDVRAVFARLRDASQVRHLPAFERCADRTRHLHPV
ncbi:ferritin-like domain-containing protein [Roseospira goensis]|uniref:Rubrerythrin n=1 Tax=Roseospira goensis TaxID=391922 RepID=A0A7W6RZB7_9PROT|nr:DUF2202 domain-containing protein [Roseospira goensis]MBB4285312.1 rubrerythrin [Roseospira goensis]